MTRTPVKNPKRNSLDAMQRDYLYVHLREVSRRLTNYKGDREIFATAPKSVKRAKRVVDRFYNSARRAERVVEKRIEKRIEVIKREILFGSHEKALKMIDKLS